MLTHVSETQRQYVTRRRAILLRSATHDNACRNARARLIPMVGKLGEGVGGGGRPL